MEEALIRRQCVGIWRGEVVVPPSGCLVSCDIGFQKAGMQVKLFLECSQSPNILRRKFRPTIRSSNDRSEKSECVKCGSVYTVQYLGRKKEKQQKLEEKCPSAKSLYLLQMEVIEMSTVGGPVQNMGTCHNPLHSYWIVAESHRRRSCFGGRQARRTCIDT